MIDAIRAALVKPGAALTVHLQLHEAPGDDGDHLAKQFAIGKPSQEAREGLYLSSVIVFVSSVKV